LGYAVLLNLLTQQQTTRAGGGGGNRNRGGQGANPQQVASQAIQKAWEKPETTISLLHAIARTHIDALNEKVVALQKDPNADVAKAASMAAVQLGLNQPAGGKELIETLPYEVVVARAIKTKGDPKLGQELFNRQLCVSCHTVSSTETPKGPFLGGIATRYSRAELCESILKPSAKIAQGFETQYFKTADGEVLDGFVSKESADEVEVRNAAGAAVILKKKDIQARGKRNFSIMPEGVVAKISPEDLSNLLAYLESLKSN